jgi:hypothetical protein
MSFNDECKKTAQKERSRAKEDNQKDAVVYSKLPPEEKTL